MVCLLRRSLLAIVVGTTILGLQAFSSKPVYAAGKRPAIPKFRLQFFDIPGRGLHMGAADINDLGQVVGSYTDATGQWRAFFYDPKINATTAMDLEAMINGAGVPQGWRLLHARSINDLGIVVGDMVSTDPDTGLEVRWGYVLDTLALVPTVTPLPEIPGVTEFSSLRTLQINNDGDILCQYNADGKNWIVVVNPFVQEAPCYLNQPVWGSSQSSIGSATASHSAIVGVRLADGSLARWNPVLDTLQVLNVGTKVTVYDINDAGHIVGVYNNLPMRLITPPPKTFNVGTQLLQGAGGINNSGDVVMNGGFLYRDDIGLIKLSSYLSGTTADLALWSNAFHNSMGSITDRDGVSKYGRVVGSLVLRDSTGQSYYKPYLLTPIVPKR